MTHSRLYWFVAALALLGLVANSSSAADKDVKKDVKKGDAAEKNAEKKTDLPLGKLVMFNSGVGFFEHRGKVQGDAQVEFKFNVKDINDLLKSMVLQDEGGGRISTVTYGSKDPITKTLQTFAVDLTNNPTLGQILNQMRGEKVSLDAPDQISGVILGVEIKDKEVGDKNQTVKVEMLNLLTDDGLRSVGLDKVGRIKLVNEKLDAELRQALQVLAMGHSTDKKAVTLNFLGAGQRAVRVGYIQETPVWKTSYRLVLGDEAPFLQGWAIVENTTEEDWNNVNLTLVSGRPISYIMDLYQPLYVNRPVVQQELYASLRPQTYGQDLGRADADFAKAAERQDRRSEGEEKSASLARSRQAGAVAGKPAASAPAADALAKRYAFANGAAGFGGGLGGGDALRLQEGVQSLAQAGNVGELFQYEIATPVTLQRQQSAMLPIVNDSVKGEKVSIYNQNVQAKHPLNGLRLTNSTDLHLMQGPITVFDGGAYAGDAKIEDLQPGTERLISYALDLDTEVAPEASGQPEQLLKVRLAKGVLFVDNKHTRTHKYTIKNSGKKAKNVLIEYPLDAQWTLALPKEAPEKTRDLYRFAVKAEPGKPATLVVGEERTVNQQIAITNLDDNAIAFYLNAKVVSDKVKEALQEVVKRKRAIQDVVQKRQQFEAQIKVVDEEQARIRQNMAQLDRNTDLYKKYVTKFTTQEDAVEKLRGQISEQQQDETKLRQALDKFLLDLDLG